MTWTVIQSAKETQSFWKDIQAEETNQTATIRLNPEKTYQTWLGFGGAITEAVGYTLKRLPEEEKEAILKAYYDPKKGLGYSLGRMHIGSSDFSLGHYDYVDEEDDELKSFSIEHEEQYVLPVVRQAESIAGQPLTFVSSPWSPPAWMKTNNDRNHGGRLKKEYYTTWARYVVRYLLEMKEKGVRIEAVTIQNEPQAVQVWDSCLYSIEEETEMVKVLSRALKDAGLDTHIVIWDHNRDLLFERADGVLKDPAANEAVWGVANHWYMSEQFEELTKVHDKYPDKHLIFTEGCIEGGVALGAWHTGERYARNIMGDMNNWLEAFIDWNIVLDETGGPNHVGNFCDAPVIADTQSHTTHYNSSYYYIGHFSRYIKPGAKRLDLNLGDSSLTGVAFKNPDQSIALVLLNEGDSDEASVLEIDSVVRKVSLPKHSITTIIKPDDRNREVE
ncbi:glycoside hydrolase family 30 protein [Alkalibacterium iburiense]|uniref:Glycoside hydrolase family 30 protein n=1 Tax=Alkalibacterium iburiense TaxID=290589 RepID=A0ABN0X8W3_9LACT